MQRGPAQASNMTTPKKGTSLLVIPYAPLYVVKVYGLLVLDCCASERKHFPRNASELIDELLNNRAKNLRAATSHAYVSDLQSSASLSIELYSLHEFAAICPRSR
jgi:hypothetical protein